MPSVSIIIPVYKAEKYIERCVRSLFSQSLSDIQFIFIDDCSPDSSIDIVKNILKEFPSVSKNTIIKRLNHNSGQHIARKFGIHFAEGEYITHCDPDDCYTCSNAIELCYNKAKEKDADIIWFDMAICEGGNLRRLEMAEKTDKISLLHRHLVDFQFMGSLCNRMVRKEIVQSPSIVYPLSPIIEDLVLVIQYTIMANRFEYIPAQYYRYYRHSESTTTSSATPENVLNRIKVVEPNLRLIEDIINKDKNLKHSLASALLYCKFLYKLRSIPYIRSTRDLSPWKEIYPEINYQIFVNNKISFRDKLVNLLMLTGLYRLFIK